MCMNVKIRGKEGIKIQQPAQFIESSPQSWMVSLPRIWNKNKKGHIWEQIFLIYLSKPLYVQHQFFCLPTRSRLHKWFQCSSPLSALVGESELEMYVISTWPVMLLTYSNLQHSQQILCQLGSCATILHQWFRFCFQCREVTVEAKTKADWRLHQSALVLTSCGFFPVLFMFLAWIFCRQHLTRRCCAISGTESGKRHLLGLV